MIHIILALFFLFTVPALSFAGECDSPPSGTYFCSDWSGGNLSDGGKWPSTDHCEVCSAVNNAPSGGPSSTYAMKVVWTDTYYTGCSDGEDYRVEKSYESPNPFYERFCFYSTDLTPAWDDAGHTDKYCRDYKFGRYAGDPDAATGIYIEPDYHYDAEEDENRPDIPYKYRVMLKNHAIEASGDPKFEEYEYNYRYGEKLTGDADWPGKETTDGGQIYNNTWHCIELGVYRHDTDGWIKFWIDGKLAINASGSAFSASTDSVVATGGSGSYDTLVAGTVETTLQLPGFRNGGGNPAHTEYFKNVILSSAPIGLPPGFGSSDSTAPTVTGCTIKSTSGNKIRTGGGGVQLRLQ